MDAPQKKKRGRPSKKTISVSDTTVRNTDVPSAVMYTLELFVADEVFTSSALTTLDALKKLPRPRKIVTKGLLVVHHGNNSKELFYMPMQLKRLYFPLAQKVIAKMLAMNI